MRDRFEKRKVERYFQGMCSLSVMTVAYVKV